MKVLLKTTLASALFTTLAFSQTTMCFKENHTNLTTLETVKLDGGECQSKLSLTDMKANGWEVDDIKINNNNYIYILKKGSVSTTVNSSNINMEDLEAKVLAKMEAKRKIEKEQKEKIQKEENASNGKNLYINKCQNCHGAKGELKPGFSSIIANLSKEDFEYSIDGYRNSTYNKGTSIQMTAYALAISDEDVNNIYDYIQSVK